MNANDVYLPGGIPPRIGMDTGAVDAMGAAFRAAMVSRQEAQTKADIKLSSFKEVYIRVRTDNIALTHQAALEIVNMIYQDASTISSKDMLL